MHRVYAFVSVCFHHITAELFWLFSPHQSRIILKLEQQSHQGTFQMEGKRPPDWWEGYPFCEAKEVMDAKYLSNYKYCTWCASGTPKVDHNTFDCIHQFDPWYEMPYESFLESRQKARKKKELERFNEGFAPTGLPQTPVSSPLKGAKRVSNYTGQMQILQSRLQKIKEKEEGFKPESYLCSYCLSNTHSPNNCWSVNPWICPEWFLKKWIKSVQPSVRHPSKATWKSWGEDWYKHIIQDEVFHHEFHYLVTVLEKRTELATAEQREEEAQRQEVVMESPKTPPPTKRTRFVTVMSLSDFKTY